MKEKIKSAALGLLVLTSLALTYILWYGSPSHEFSQPIASEMIHFSSSRSLTDLITPDRVVFYPGDDVYHVFRPGQELFQVGVTLFKSSLQETVHVEPADAEANINPERAGIRLDFPYPYPLEGQGGQEDSFFEITQFFLPLEGNEAWFITSKGDYFLLRLGRVRHELLRRFSNAEELPPYRLADAEDLPPEIAVDFVRDIYLPLEKLSLPVQQWEQERFDLDRLLKVFFIDMSLVRRIEEKDGAVIYTDGQEGVRIYPDGAVEYTTAGSKEGILSGDQALSLAGEIIALYGGWAPSVYLWAPSGSEPVKDRQQLFFVPYAGGSPLVSSEGGISLTVSKRGAQSYFRNLMVPADEPLGVMTIVSAPAAFDLALEYAHEEWGGEEKLPVHGFYLGYYLRDPLSELKQVVAAWILEVEGFGLAVINAANGLPVTVLRY